MKGLNIFGICLAAALALPIYGSAEQTKFTQGTLIVLNKSEATATLISLDTGETMATLGTGIGPHEVAVSPNGKLAVVCNYSERPSTLTVIDLERRRPVRTIHLGEYIAPHGIVFMPDGERVIATVERSRAVVVVNLKSREVEKAISTADLACHMIAVTPDGTKAFGASIGAGAISVMDLKSGEHIKTIKTGAGAEGIEVTPDGREVWVTNRAANTISIIDVAKLEVVRDMISEKFPIRVKFTPDGKYALVSNANSGDVAVFDVQTRREFRRISMEVKASEDIEGRLFNQFGESPAPIGILITPDGSHAFIANTRADIVTVIDLKQWKIKDRLVPGREPDGMAYSQLEMKN
jgi:YVTN family beta-propeller protein